MRWLYVLARFYPFWALPTAFILGEFGMFFFRRGQSRYRFFFGMVGFLLVTTVLWFILRGDLNSDNWVKGMIG